MPPIIKPAVQSVEKGIAQEVVEGISSVATSQHPVAPMAEGIKETLKAHPKVGPPVGVWNRYNAAQEQKDAEIEDMLFNANADVAMDEPEPEPMPDPFTLVDPADLAPGNFILPPEEAQAMQQAVEAHKASKGAMLSAPREGHAEDFQAEVKARNLQEGRPSLKIGKFEINDQFMQLSLGRTGRGTTDIGEDVTAVAGAGLDALHETIQGIGMIHNFITGEESALQDLARKIPKVAPSTSWRNQTVRGFLQYATLFVPALGATKAGLAKGLGTAWTGLKGSSPVTASVIDSGIADGLATWFGMDGDDASIAEVLQTYAPSLTKSKLYPDFMRYVTSAPGDSEASKRWMNVLEGQIMGALVGYTLKPKQAIQEFKAMSDGVQRTVWLRKYLGNELGAVGGGMRPGNALPLIRGEMDAAIKEGVELERLLKTVPDARKPHVEARIAANKERLTALQAGQDRAQTKILVEQAEAQVETVSKRAQTLQAKVEKGEAEVQELADNMGPNPNNATKNKLSRKKLALRRNKAELTEVMNVKAEAEGALQATKAKPELEFAPAPEGGPMRVPSIFGDVKPEGVIQIDPLSRNNAPLGDDVAQWLLDNREMAQQMEKPIRDQFGERIAIFRQKGAGEHAKLLKMMDDYAIPIEKLDEYKPGSGGTVEEQAAFASLTVELYGRVKSLSDALKNAPQDKHLMAAWEQALLDVNKANAIYMGMGSQAGRMEMSRNVFNNVMNEAGVGRGLDLIRTHGGGISEGDKVALAAMLSATPPKNTGRFANIVGKLLGKGNKWVDALVEGFVSTRFTPLTIGKNIIGTSVMQASGVAARLGAGMATAAHLPGTKGSNITVTEGIKMAHGMLTSVTDMFKLYRDMKFGFDGKIDFMDVASKMENVRTPAISAQGLEIENNVGAALANGLGYLTRTMTRQMVAWDQVFQMAARNGQRQAIAWRESVKKINTLGMEKTLSPKVRSAMLEREYDKLLSDFPEHLENQVKLYGEYTTFADAFRKNTDPSIESLGLAVTNFAHAHPMVKLLFPFIRTSVRIGQATTKYGLPILGAMMKDTEDFLTAVPAERAAINYGKQAVGAAAGFMALGLAYNRMIIGEAPGAKDPDARELWKRNGWREMSIITQKDENGMPLKSIPLKGMVEPIGGIMRASTDAMYILQSMFEKAEAGDLEDNFMQEAGEYMKAFTSTMMKITEDQLFFSQFTGLMDAVSRGDEKSLNRWLASFTPAPVREFAELMNPYVRELETFGDHLKAQIPGLRSGVAVKYNFLGEPYVKAFGVFDEEAPPGFINNLLRDVSPVMATGDFDSKWRPVWDFLMENADMSVGIRHQRNLDGVRMTAEQQAAYARIRGGGEFKMEDGQVIPPVRNPGTGETLREALLDIVTSNEYGEGTEGLALRRGVFQSTVRAYGDMAKAQMWAVWPKLQQDSANQKVERALKGGM